MKINVFFLFLSVSPISSCITKKQQANQAPQSSLETSSELANFSIEEQSPLQWIQNQGKGISNCANYMNGEEFDFPKNEIFTKLEVVLFSLNILIGCNPSVERKNKFLERSLSFIKKSDSGDSYLDSVLVPDLSSLKSIEVFDHFLQQQINTVTYIISKLEIKKMQEYNAKEGWRSPYIEVVKRLDGIITYLWKVNRIKEELGQEYYIFTHGMSTQIASLISLISVVDRQLTNMNNPNLYSMRVMNQKDNEYKNIKSFLMKQEKPFDHNIEIRNQLISVDTNIYNSADGESALSFISRNKNMLEQYNFDSI